MRKIIRYLFRAINYLFGLMLLLIVIALTWHFVPPLNSLKEVKCSNKYPLTETYKLLSLDHNWSVEEVPFKGITSHKSGMKDGVQIYSNYEYDKISKKNDLFSGIASIRHNYRHGFYFGYSDEILWSVDYYKEGKREGINFNFQKGYPSLLVIYEGDKNMGMVDFWEYGRIRSVKFGAKYNKSGTKHNSTYDNGQKAFEYIEENGVKYWVVYNPKGEMLVRYPTDNDFCKAEFYENGKKVEIPYYFDQKEFEMIYDKIKQDANKS